MLGTGLAHHELHELLEAQSLPPQTLQWQRLDHLMAVNDRGYVRATLGTFYDWFYADSRRTFHVRPELFLKKQQLNLYYEDLIEIIEELKSRSVMIVVGGPMATVEPECLEGLADVVFIGEARLGPSS